MRHVKEITLYMKSGGCFCRSSVDLIYRVDYTDWEYKVVRGISYPKWHRYWARFFKWHCISENIIHTVDRMAPAATIARRGRL